MTYGFNFTPVFRNFDLLLGGAWLTLQLSAATMLLGLLVGLVGAAIKVWGPRPARWAVAGYVEFIRNTPFLVQLFIVFFGLPSLGFRLTAGGAAVIGLTVYVGAYITEIIRSGIESIPKGQIEAGRSLALSPLQVFRYVIIFPALKVTYPALTSQFILLMLGSSVVSIISAEELFHTATFLESRTFLPFEIYLVVSAMYLVMSLGFRLVFLFAGHLAFGRR